jgi:hypothetical protein
MINKDIISRKITVDLHFRSAFIAPEALKEPTHVYVEWERGKNKMCTKPKEMSEQAPLVFFNERFNIKTNCEFNKKKGRFELKESKLMLI